MAIAGRGGGGTLTAFHGTGVFFRTQAARAARAFVPAAANAAVCRRPTLAARRAAGFAAVVPIMVEQDAAPHAASRLEGGRELMLVTAVHKLGAFVWVGGVITLVLSWRRRRTDTAGRTHRLCPLARFTPLVLAASLASPPPAGDVARDGAGPAGIRELFSPQVPRLPGPQRGMIAAAELNNIVTGRLGMKGDLRRSRFSHNLSGVILLSHIEP